MIQSATAQSPVEQKESANRREREISRQKVGAWISAVAAKQRCPSKPNTRYRSCPPWRKGKYARGCQVKGKPYQEVFNISQSRRAPSLQTFRTMSAECHAAEARMFICYNPVGHLRPQTVTVLHVLDSWAPWLLCQTAGEQTDWESTCSACLTYRCDPVVTHSIASGRSLCRPRTMTAHNINLDRTAHSWHNEYGPCGVPRLRPTVPYPDTVSKMTAKIVK